MKILVLTNYAELNGLAKELGKEHEVKTYVKSNLYNAAGIGQLDRIGSWRPELRGADLIISDIPHTPAEIKTIKEWGKACFGVSDGNVLTEGPLESISNISYVVFWNGRKWVRPGFLIITEDRLLADNLGPEIDGHMNTMVVPGKLAIEEQMNHITQELINTNYRGPVSFSVQLIEDKIQIISITNKIKAMQLAPILKLMKIQPLDFILETANGANMQIPLSNSTAGAARMYLPPFPYRMPAGVFPQGTIEIKPEIQKHLWLTDVSNSIEAKEDSALAVHIGASGSFGFAITTGRPGKTKDTFRETRRRLIRTISGVSHELLQYRNDINQSAQHTLDTLKNKGVFICQTQ